MDPARSADRSRLEELKMLSLATLRALKGAPLSILIAMVLAQQPVGEKWLVTVTGYSPNTVRTGLSFLEETQMVGRNGRYSGYVLMDKAIQLPLTKVEAGERQKMTLDPITTTTFNKYEDEKSEENAAAVEAGASKIDARLISMMHEEGIMEPTASQLLDLPWVNEKYLVAHFKKARSENTPVALLIHRLRSHDPKPMTESEKYWESWGIKAEEYEQR